MSYRKEGGREGREKGGREVGKRREGGREGGRRWINYSQCFPLLLMYLSEVSVEPWLSVERLLAPSYRALVLLRLAVDGLDVH